MSTETDKLGYPDIEIGGLRVWIHGREFPDSEDVWDGNWLRATAECSAEGARVTTSGAILHLLSFKRWADAVDALYESLNGRAVLEPIEPNLSVSLAGDGLGSMLVQVGSASTVVNV